LFFIKTGFCLLYFCKVKKGFRHITSVIAFVVIAFASTILQAQTYNIATYNGMTVTTCSGNFYDSGGSGGNYGNNENYVVTFCSASGSPLYFDFTSSSSALNLDAGTGDTLFFYDGLTTSDPLIATLVKADDYAFSYPAVGTFSSCVTIKWKSNASAVDGGWQASISCEEPPTCADNPPAADVFGQATAVCNLNDYCGTTSRYYGEDAPFNFGGTGGSCPGPDDGLFAGTLENNSWLKFIADATSASFDFNVTGGASCDGVQVGIFSFDAATNTFARKSPCNYTDGGWSGAFTLTATGLTVGQTYYMMIDGNAGSNCDYTIGAGTGVATVSAGADQIVCAFNTTLAATTAMGSGTWSVVSGTGVFADATNPTTYVSGLSYGINVFRWTSTGGLCMDVGAYDDVVVENTCLLPITLSDFTATVVDDMVRLNWTTASEIDNDHFVLERAGADQQFMAIAEIMGSGTTTIPVNYTYTDDMPLPAVNYYRLKQVDVNANTSTSNVIAIESHSDAQTFTIGDCYFDNASEVLTIPYQTSASVALDIQLCDIAGRILFSATCHTTAVNDNAQVDLHHLTQTGLILLQITGDNGVRSNHTFWISE